jgi:hypothetical protein
MRFWPRGLGIGGRYGRAFVAALLVNQFAVASGLPFPTPDSAIKKDLSKPFPCMNRPCGCQNADQCWHECCCFTMREKLAWAEANGVTPPDFVREAAAREALADASNAGHEHGVLCQEKHCCCCRCKASQSGDDSKECDKQTCDKQLCDKHAAVAAASVPPAQPSNEPVRDQDGSKSIVLLMALGCRGQSSFSLLALALPFVRRPTISFVALPIGTVFVRTELFTSHSEAPTVPPPERLLAALLGCSVIERG